VVDAIKKQAETLIHTCFQMWLCMKNTSNWPKNWPEIFPHGEHGTKVMITNSGAEAVGNAIKIARQATGKSGILSLDWALSTGAR
jgi:4-aminobutyrate aminotransferase/(S)-3-amino-2-methylpropionate transaminase